MRYPKAIACTLVLLPCALLLASRAIDAETAIAMLQWDSRSFAGWTRYSALTEAGESVLQADAESAASTLYRAEHIDLRATPYLKWRWRTQGIAGSPLDETSKAGDDYALRVYVVRRGGLAFWRSKAINYVWAGSQPVQSRWPNPFAGNNVQMWAVDSGSEQLGQWREHVRDVRADWRAAFGEDIDSLDGLALMTDTDNSGRSVRSWYDNLRFEARPE